MDRPLQYCTEPGCNVRVKRGRCDVHAIVRRESARPDLDVRRWYRTERWTRLRRAVMVDAACQCAACGAVTLRIEVDHVVPHHGDPALFWNRANLQALCHDCHTNKTNRGE